MPTTLSLGILLSRLGVEADEEEVASQALDSSATADNVASIIFCAVVPARASFPTSSTRQPVFPAPHLERALQAIDAVA